MHPVLLACTLCCLCAGAAGTASSAWWGPAAAGSLLDLRLVLLRAHPGLALGRGLERQAGAKESFCSSAPGATGMFGGRRALPAGVEVVAPPPPLALGGPPAGEPLPLPLRAPAGDQPPALDLGLTGSPSPPLTLALGPAAGSGACGVAGWLASPLTAAAPSVPLLLWRPNA
jgi:hypothetical protein